MLKKTVPYWELHLCNVFDLDDFRRITYTLENMAGWELQRSPIHALVGNRRNRDHMDPFAAIRNLENNFSLDSFMGTDIWDRMSIPPIFHQHQLTKVPDVFHFESLIPSHLQQSSLSFPEKGSYSSRVMSYSYSVGPDKQPKVEKFMSVTNSNLDRKTREVCSAYSNSYTGVDKVAVERQLADRSRKIIRSRNILKEEEESHDIISGMKEEDIDQFDRDWSKVSSFLPSTSRFNVDELLPPRRENMHRYHRANNLTYNNMYSNQLYR